MGKVVQNPAVEALAKEMMIASNPVLSGQHGPGFMRAFGSRGSHESEIVGRVRAFVAEHPSLSTIR